MHLNAMRLASAAALTLSAAAPQGPTPLWAGLTPGPQAVGFVSAIEIDPGRRLDGRGRPVQVGCWYPAASPPESSFRGSSPAGPAYRDYFILSASERGPADARAARQAVDDYTSFFKQNTKRPNVS